GSSVRDGRGQDSWAPCLHVLVWGRRLWSTRLRRVVLLILRFALTVSGRGAVLARHVAGEVRDSLGHAIEAQLVQEPGEVISERLALDQDWQKGLGTGVDEAPLL